MKILSWKEFLESRQGNRRAGGDGSGGYAATVGVFDGLHLGHAALVDAVLARAPRCASAVITFLDSPKRILRPSSFRGDLISREGKLAGFAARGVDFCVLIDFSADFGTLSGVDFLRALKGAGTDFLAVGPDFRCGHRQDTDVRALGEICGRLGMETEIVGPVLYSGHPVSSSRIRHAVMEGRLHDAERMLGRHYEVEFRPAAGPSARAEAGPMRFPEGRVVPPYGTYMAELLTGSGSDRVKAEVRVTPEGVVTECPEARSARGIVFLEWVSREF